MSKIYVVGIGPGDKQFFTGQALAALEESEVIIGYTVYTALVEPLFPDKKYMDTPMRKEVDRCRLAFEEAKKGATVSMVCSGDSGVYGMAGLMYEIQPEYSDVELVIVPGLSAVMSGASVLGAPLMHDFAVISLSDLLTPLELIKKRLDAAASADFVICLYNPSSHKRKDYLMQACDIVLKHASPDTVCGIVRNIGRKGEESKILTLKELRDTEVDMFSTVFIGNSMTKVLNGKMVTPRGYSIN